MGASPFRPLARASSGTVAQLIRGRFEGIVEGAFGFGFHQRAPPFSKRFVFSLCPGVGVSFTEGALPLEHGSFVESQEGVEP